MNYVEQAMNNYYKNLYSIRTLDGVSLLEWTRRWFKMSNDDFFNRYGFNFNPHDYPQLYLIARKEVHGS